MNFLLKPPLKYAHKWRGKKAKQQQIKSVGCTEKHKYDVLDHSRRLHVVFDAHPKEFIGVKLQQTVFLTGLDKYIGTVCIVQKIL